MNAKWRSSLQHAHEAMDRFIMCDDVTTVLDVGAGVGYHAAIMRKNGMEVTTVSLTPPADVVADYMDTNLGPVDGIWASHVLEHIPNVGSFLAKCYADLREGGVLAVTVPPPKEDIVGGHLSIWTEGLLVYRLILAGFDCSAARVGSYDYNLSVIVRKKPMELPPLKMDAGDIEALAPFFPLRVEQSCDGSFGSINW